MIKYSVESLGHDLADLGVKGSDILLVRADISKIGRVEGNVGETILGSLLKAVGKEGTIVALSFTDSFLLNNIDQTYTFNRATVPNTGAFAKIVLGHKDAIRSEHPTNSFVAIGAKAKEIMAGHDEASKTYSPVKTMMEMGAKMLLIGCVGNSPGFTTVHLAQEELGYSSKSFLRNRFSVWYEKNGKRMLYKRNSLGGCSMGFDKFYKHYINKEILRTGLFGKAYSMIINARDAYAVEYEILKRDPRFALCDDPDCYCCRATWSYNLRDIPFYYLRKTIKGIDRIRRKLTGC